MKSINTGTRRKPFTLREWAMERLVDATLGTSFIHTKKGLRRYQERMGHERAVIVAFNEAMARIEFLKEKTLQ